MNLDNYAFDFGKVSILFFATILMGGLAASTLVVNSDDWTDVNAGMQLADYNNETPYFVQTSDGSAVMTELPQGATINLYESESQSYLDMESRFSNRGYNVNSSQSFDSQLDLVPESYDDFVLISRSQSTSVTSAASLANHLDAWTVVVDENNQDEVEEVLANADGEVTQVGGLTTSEEDRLEEFVTEHIDGENRFDLSINVLERIEEDEEISTVLVSDGTGLERDMFTSDNPVLLTGDNYLPEEAEEYVRNNEDLGTVIVLGANLASVSEEINDLAGEDRDIRTLLKFGQASPGGAQEEAVAISFYPLPLANIDLDILTAEYIPGSEELVVTFENPSEAEVYKTSSITVMDENGDTVETLDDDSAELIPSESTQVVTYDAEELDEGTAENAEAEFTTSYGSNPDNLDSFVASSEEDVFGPPRTLPVSVLDIEDRSNLEIEEVNYNVDQEGFEITASNPEDVETYSRLSVENLNVDGVSQSFSSDMTIFGPESSQTVFVPARLSETDLEENRNANVYARFGERESFLINSYSLEAEFETITDGLTDSRTIIVLLLLAAAITYAVYKI